MTPRLIHDQLVSTYADVVPKMSWGETAFFVNPGGKLPSGSYFVTIKEKDGDNDKASNLDRDGVFRLNFGPGRKAFEKHFGTPPVRPAKGGVIEGPWDFTKLNRLMPHPVYGWMSWMCILNPEKSSFEALTELLDSAHQKSSKSAAHKLRKFRA